MTVAADASDLQELKLITDSKNDEAICVLSSSYSYFESIELALKIRKYIKQKNVSQLPDTIQKSLPIVNVKHLILNYKPEMNYQNPL